MVRGRLSSIPDLESRVFVTRALDSPLLARIVDVGTNQGDLCPEIHRASMSEAAGKSDSTTTIKRVVKWLVARDSGLCARHLTLLLERWYAFTAADRNPTARSTEMRLTPVAVSQDRDQILVLDSLSEERPFRGRGEKSVMYLWRHSQVAVQASVSELNIKPTVFGVIPDRRQRRRSNLPHSNATHPSPPMSKNMSCPTPSCGGRPAVTRARLTAAAAAFGSRSTSRLHSRITNHPASVKARLDAVSRAWLRAILPSQYGPFVPNRNTEG